jgi:3-dehydroquinate synthase
MTGCPILEGGRWRSQRGLALGSEVTRGLSGDSKDGNEGAETQRAMAVVPKSRMPLAPPPEEALYQQRFSVSYGYPVLFCRGALDPSSDTLAWAIARTEPERRHPTFAVIDQGLADAQGDLEARVTAYAEAHASVLELRAEPELLPGGEASKHDPRLLDWLAKRFVETKLDRHATVLVIGGGAVLDAAGYAASTFHRGVRTVRMPSTVLAQCDGGVGVKTGVNGHGAKNLFGTFAPPHAVVNDELLLETLPLREARAGMAEAVKVGLIRDATLFEFLESNAEALSQAAREPLRELVRRAARLHLAHIAGGGDPFETGSARPLDYGHWAAHKLEMLSGHELRHGEAVAIGMLLDARYAELSGLLPASARARLETLLDRLGLPLYHPSLDASSSELPLLLEGLDEFREHLGGELCVTLLTDIGRSVEVHAMDTGRVADAVRYLTERRSR